MFLESARQGAYCNVPRVLSHSSPANVIERCVEARVLTPSSRTDRHEPSPLYSSTCTRRMLSVVAE
jgi:hypothetical protein